jgi:uncharacterized membrane protein YeiH
MKYALAQVGAAVFAVSGVLSAAQQRLNIFSVVVVMGLITSIAGGILRDVVTHRPTMLLSRELYATPIVLGGILYVLLLRAIPSPWGRLMAMGLVFVIRATATRGQLFLPLRLTLKVDPP